MERRGMPRPSLTRNLSSFSRALTALKSSEDIDNSTIPTPSHLDDSTKEQLQRDLELVRTVGTGASTHLNRYETWECAFDFTQGTLTPSDPPKTRKLLTENVTRVLETIANVKTGLVKYAAAISSEEHAIFSESFLDKQCRATEITVAQLDMVRAHLEEVLARIGDGDADQTVDKEIRAVVADAEPWVAKCRAVMVHSHVYYKVNYALVSGKKA